MSDAHVALKETEAAFVASVTARFAENQQVRVTMALSMARQAHQDQIRRSGEPYLIHPIRVAMILIEELEKLDADMVIAALLHDVLEDAPEIVGPEEIHAEFGPEVLNLVQALTAPSARELPNKLESSRLKAAKVEAATVSARYVKIADRIDNLRDIYTVNDDSGREFRVRYQHDSSQYYLPMVERLGDEKALNIFLTALAKLRTFILRENEPRSIMAADIGLDVERMFLPTDVHERYANQQARALDEMSRLERGEIVNTDEGWQTGHYWLRGSAHTPPEHATVIKAALASIDEFARETFSGHFDNILWIGIGGSALGPQMLYDILRTPGKTPLMFFLDNTDPDGFERTFLEIGQVGGLEKTLVVVVSKSGGTKETRNGMLAAKQAYEKAGLDFERHAVAITKPGSKLDKLASPASEGDAAGPPWLARFPIWDWVGGRTSLFSPVGMLPAKLLGFDRNTLLKGAHAMDVRTLGSNPATNPAMLLATTWYHMTETLGLRNMVVLPYCDRLLLFGRYLQQLIMESIGKSGKGITVYGNKGSTDQHSFVQQLRDGYRDFFVVFVRVTGQMEASHAQSSFTLEVEPGATANDYLLAYQEGTAKALCDAGRLSLTIKLNSRPNEENIGGLVALFERAVGYYAAMLEINAYHQPGVEAGKTAADEIVNLQQRVIEALSEAQGKTLSVAELAERTSGEPRVVKDVLMRLSTNANIRPTVR